MRQLWSATTTKVLEMQEIRVPRYVADALGLEVGIPVILVRRLRSVADEPAAIDTAYGWRPLFLSVAGRPYWLIHRHHGWGRRPCGLTPATSSRPSWPAVRKQGPWGSRRTLR